MQRWKQSELDYLQENWGQIDTYLIAWKLRRNQYAVEQMYRKVMKTKTPN